MRHAWLVAIVSVLALLAPGAAFARPHQHQHVSEPIVGAIDTLGRSVSLTYDAYGNVASTSDGTASASFTFDVGNRLRTSRDGLGNATELRYEQVGCGCSERDEVAGVHTPDLPAGWSGR